MTAFGKFNALNAAMKTSSFKTDFGDIQTGCNNTPTRGSYFCTAQRECDLGFQVEGKTLFFKPNEIKTTKNHSSILIIY